MTPGESIFFTRHRCCSFTKGDLDDILVGIEEDKC